jgi:phage shock protein PspC (stress-responsive transcriptional regulator)
MFGVCEKLGKTESDVTILRILFILFALVNFNWAVMVYLGLVLIIDP